MPLPPGVDSILALDLGTATGFAITTRGRTGAGTVQLASEPELRRDRKGEANHGWDVRYGALFGLVLGWLDDPATGSSRVLAWEDVQFVHSRDQIMCWTTLRAAIWGACAARDYAGVTLFPVSVGELKLFASGAWGAPKELMAASAVARGWLRPGHGLGEDAVDAVCLLHLASGHLLDPVGTRRRAKAARKVDRRQISDRFLDHPVVQPATRR